MLGLLISRFRVVMLLLAFGAGMAGGILSDAAMGSQMQDPMQSAPSTGHPCPACPAGQNTGMMPGCTSMATCWTVPALPAAQEAGVQVPPEMTFAATAGIGIAGIASAPDPRPPRSFLRIR